VLLAEPSRIAAPVRRLQCKLLPNRFIAVVRSTFVKLGFTGEIWSGIQLLNGIVTG